MRRLFLIIFVFLILTFIPNEAFAQSYATCDLCGYCAPTAPTPTILPGNWTKCAECIYPNAANNPDSKQTLLIPDGTNNPPTPYPGNQYTMFGCIRGSVNPLDIIQEGPARSLTDILLSNIFSIVGGLAFLYLIYGSFILMTSQSNPERINYGKRVVFGAITGLIFSLSAVFIIRTLASGILKIPGIK